MSRLPPARGPPADGRGQSDRRAVALALGLALCCLLALPVPVVAGPVASTTDATVGVAPGVAPAASTGTLSTPSAVADATTGIDAGGQVAVGDVVVLSLSGPGLLDAVAAAEGSNDTERVLAAREGPDLNLSVVQTNPGAEESPKRLDLAGPGVRFVVDDADEVVHAVVDTGVATATRPDDGGGTTTGLDLAAGETYETSLAVEGAETVTSFAVVERRASVVVEPETGALYRGPATGQVVWGNATLAPGSTVTITVDGADWNRTVETTTRASASPDAHATPAGDTDAVGRWSFAATVDLSGAGEGDSAELSVRARGEGLLDASIPVEVADPAASVEVAGVSNESARVAVDLSGSLSEGGFLVLHRGDADGPVLATSDYLGPGSHEATVTLGTADLTERARVVAVAYHDADLDGTFASGTDARYGATSAASAGFDVALVDDGDETTTGTATTGHESTTADGPTTTDRGTTTPGTDADDTRATTTGTDGATDTGTTAGTTQTGTPSGPVPGFGPGVALLAVALVGVALVARTWRG